MVGTGLDQGIARDTAVSQQLFGIAKRHDLVRAAVKDGGSGFHDADGSEPAPRRTQKNQSYIGLPKVHRNGSATAGPDDDIRLALIHFVLGDSHRFLKVVVRQPGIKYHVPALLEKDRLDATRNGLPSVKEKNLHDGILQPEKF